MGRDDYGHGISSMASGKAGIIEAVVSWCEALNGALSLQAALEELVPGLGAEAGMIVRTYMNDLRPVRVALFDRVPDRVCNQPLRSSFADEYFGSDLARTRAATVWLASSRAEGAERVSALADWHETRHMRDFAVLVLSAGPSVRDHIELHFHERLSPEMESLLATLVPTMARVWASRSAGLITRTIVNHRNAKPQAPARPILSAENPSHLSRAEFRVCLMLSNGLSVKGIADSFSLSETTIRTHLRNIYAKTDCNSLAELVFHLLEMRWSDDFPEARIA